MYNTVNLSTVTSFLKAEKCLLIHQVKTERRKANKQQEHQRLSLAAL